jgi:acetoacetyl-CoA synthetase
MHSGNLAGTLLSSGDWVASATAAPIDDAMMSDILWELSPAAKRRTQMGAFLDHLRATDAPDLLPADAPEAFAVLHRWSTAHPDRFWPHVWRFASVVAGAHGDAEPWREVGVGLDRLAPPDATRGPRWFLGASLNYAENLLRFGDDAPAIIAWTETGPYGRMSYGELRATVAACAAALRAVGVGPGDRVAGFLPNLPEAVIAMLATTSLGAVWSSCSPDFGSAAVIDRFGQIAPRVLFAADGYRYAGKRVDLRSRVAEIAAGLPRLDRLVIVPYLETHPSLALGPTAYLWSDFLRVGGSAAPAFARGAFDQPAVILYSSGTTGLPKCIVHGGGGMLLQLLKEHLLHVDIRRPDRVFYATTCGWMMWNWLVTALATGTTIVLYDGAPLPPTRPSVLWDLAAAEGVTVFGTSAKYLALAEKLGLAPARSHDLRSLRAVLSTGSPLAPQSFDYVYRDISRTVQLASISGGTDIVSCFVLGNPLSPVRRGEIQGRGLGMAVQVFDAAARPVVDAPGELVCTRPFPSMPVAFWNDPDGVKYRAAYFDRFPGVWYHGDWARITSAGGVVIYGRSDTTLNPGGVRIGTAEIYRQVEHLPEVLESVVVGREIPLAGAASGAPSEDVVGAEVEVVLFVRLADGHVLNEALGARIRDVIRRNTSPHHVPRRIHAVRDIPRTLSGKIAEMAVREALHGRPVKNTDALANPLSLEEYRALAGRLDW